MRSYVHLISSPGVQSLVSISGKLVQAPGDYNSLLRLRVHFKVLLAKEDRLQPPNRSCEV